MPLVHRILMFQAFAGSMAMMSFVALAGPLARLLGLEPWHLGAAMTVAGIGWMVMSRIWGLASDRHGRRRILLWGGGGFALSYLLLSLFIDVALQTAMAPMAAFAGLLIGRGVAGIFYSAVPPTTMALVADNVPPRHRTAAMGAVGASSAAGMVIGPGFAGLVAPFSISLPLYATAALPILALLMVWRFLPGAPPQDAPKRKPLSLADPRIRRPLMAAFAAMFSVTIAQMTIGFVALDRLHLSPAAAANASGIALGIVGLSLACAQMILQKLDWRPALLIRLGCATGAVGFASAAIATNAPMLWASFAVAAFGMGWVYPSVSALAANNVASHEQGSAAGAIGAVQGLGTILGPIAGTTVYMLDTALPFLLVGAVLVATALWPAKDRPAGNR